jgi:tight adherence protein C
MHPTVLFGAAAVVGSLFLLWWAVSGERSAKADLAGPSSQGVFDLRKMSLQQSAADRAVNPFLTRLGLRARRFLPSARLDALNHKILHAGSPKGWTVERAVALKVLLALALSMVFLLRFIGAPSGLNAVLIGVGAVLGFFLPDGLLDRKGEARKLAIRGEVSDTIDQLAVMVRAGLGIDAALARVARSGRGPLAEEITRAMQDMRVGVNRTTALSALAERTDVAELKSFTAALTQAEQLGVPVAKTLQVQSDELREKRRQLAEEQAMKLPVKILFPLVACILPVLFIVVLGPAAIRIMQQLS